MTLAQPRPSTAPRRLTRRLPLAAWAVALVTLANSVAWGLIVPPLQVPDEPSHVFYTQYLAETGELPRASPDVAWYSADITGLIDSQRFYDVIGWPMVEPRSDAAALSLLRGPQERGERAGVGDASSATSNPPLYYAAQAAVYAAVRDGDVTDRLAVMRLLSALMAALTALAIFLFLRELLPGRPLAWVAGGLVAGLQPMFGFITSGVNNDAGLFLVSALLFLVVARVLRRGLTARRAAVAGLLLGVGALVKIQVLAFGPGVAFALLVAAWRCRAAGRAWRPVGVAALAAAAPLLAYGVLGATVWDRPVLDRVNDVTGGSGPPGRPWQLAEQLSYLWQLYLPRLPFMTDLHSLVPPYHLWFKGLVGRFGWLDYGFPGWVYQLAFAVAVVLVVLAATFVAQRRAVVRERLAEAGAFGLMAVGMAGAIGVVGYRTRVDSGGVFEQARYLLPLLPLYALLVALAVLGAGRRFAPPVAVLLVVAAGALSIAGQLQTLMRYYG